MRYLAAQYRCSWMTVWLSCRISEINTVPFISYRLVIMSSRPKNMDYYLGLDHL